MYGLIHCTRDLGGSFWYRRQDRGWRAKVGLMLTSLAVVIPPLVPAHLVVLFPLKLRHLLDVSTVSCWREGSGHCTWAFLLPAVQLGLARLEKRIKPQRQMRARG